jgi:WD40 repeat protein
MTRVKLIIILLLVSISSTAQNFSIEIQAGLSSTIRRIVPVEDNQIIVASKDGDFVLWNLGENKIIQKITIDNSAIYDVKYMKNRKILIVCTSEKIYFYQYQNHQLTPTFNFACDNSTSITTAEEFIWIACENKIIQGELKDNRLAINYEIPTSEGAIFEMVVLNDRLLAFNNRGPQIYSLSENKLIKKYDEWNTGWHAHYWDENEKAIYLPRENNLFKFLFKNDSFEKSMFFLPVDRDENITGIAMSRTKNLYVGTKNGNLFEFKKTDQNLIRTDYHYTTPTKSINFLLPVEGLMIYGDYYGNAKLFIPENKKEIFSLNENETAALNAVFLSPNNQMITTHKGPSGTQLKIWDVKNVVLKYQVQLQNHQVKIVEFKAKDTMYSHHVDGAVYRHFPTANGYKTEIFKKALVSFSPGAGLNLFEEEPMYLTANFQQELKYRIQKEKLITWEDGQKNYSLEYAVGLPPFECKQLLPVTVIEKYYAASTLQPFIKNWDLVDKELLIIKSCNRTAADFVAHAATLLIPEKEALDFYNLLKGKQPSEFIIYNYKKEAVLRLKIQKQLDYFGSDKSQKTFFIIHDDKVSLFHIVERKLKTYPLEGFSKNFHFAISQEYLALADPQKVQLIDLKNDSSESTSWLSFGKEDYIVYNQKGYFKTKSRSNRLLVKKNNVALPFVAFDLEFNRPDVVLKQLNTTETEEVSVYSKAVAKRINRMHRQVPVFSTMDNFDAKANLNFPLFTPTSLLYVNKYYGKERSLQLWINGTKEKLESGQIILSPGLNKIEWQITNATEDTIFQTAINYCYNNEISENKEKWYFLGAAIDEYENSSMNLKYAQKDIRDLTDYFSNQTADSSIDTLMNKSFSKEGINNWKKIAASTKVNDVLIVSLSGHGFLDSAGNFFFGIYSTNINSLNDAISYEELMEVLDAAPSRRKILFLDACHSGIKDDLAIQQKFPSNIKARGVTPLNANKKGTSSIQPFRLMQEEFLDLSKHNGTLVIAAAAGHEFAFETKEQQNGLFTYVLLQGLKENMADVNKDGKVFISELQSYLNKEVERLSKGLQKPTTRQENLGMDWHF